MEQEMVARLVHHFKVDVPDQQYAVSNMAALTLKVAALYGHCHIWQ